MGRTSQSFLPGAFDDPKVSREHARIEHDGHGLRVHDLGSHNGTFVNGASTSERELEVGDVVGVGNVLLLVGRGPESYDEPDDDQLWGTSHALSRVLEQVERVARESENVLVVGESGTGKELVARAIHERSGCAGAYVPLNCGGLPEGVLHSELFGHVRGAFSGAEGDRMGLVQVAEEGTLFLDEIASAPPALQTSLLRLLDDQMFRVVGTSQLIAATLRVVAAMQPAEEQGRQERGVRSDLYFRLSRRVIRVPSLAERREDIPVLAQRFANDTAGRRIRLSPRLVLELLRRAWPGNVRELRSVVEQVTLEQRECDELTPPSWLARSMQPETNAPCGPAPTAPKRRRRPSRDRLVAQLRAHDGSVAAVASSMQVDRKTIYRWIEAHAVDLDELRNED
jgi:transcriptional regulator with PAS, ATPase and Fis domain